MYQTYDFAQGRWVHSTEIMDMFIGELWVDEVSEAEADAFIAKKAREFGSHGSSDGAARREDAPVHRMHPACFSAMVCTSAHYRRLDGGFSLNASQKTEANSITTIATATLTRLIAP